jgi:hypothetical protein
LRFTAAGAKEHEAKIRERIQALNQKQRLRSPTWATVDPSLHAHYDNLKPGVFDSRDTPQAKNPLVDPVLAPQRFPDEPQRIQIPLNEPQRVPFSRQQ